MLEWFVGAAILAAVTVAVRRARSAVPGYGPGASPVPAEDCDRSHTAHLTDGRAREPITLIVLHSTEGDTARSAAQWFEDPASEGSAHVVVGEDGCYRTLPDEADAAGAGTPNPRALHIEFAGYAKWSREQWLQRTQTLALGIQQIARWSRKYGIPLEQLSLEAIKAKKPGVTTHAAVNQVYGGSHWDPGSGFPIDVVLEQARVLAQG